MSEERPVIDLKFPQVAVCAIHGEPFRKEWPKGYAQLVILTLELIQADAQLAEEAGGDPLKLGAALQARPACERVERGRLMTAYVDSGIGVPGRCVGCGRERLGTEYQRSSPGRFGRTRVETIPHICFDCVLDRIVAA